MKRSGRNARRDRASGRRHGMPWISISPPSTSQKSSRHLISVVLPAPLSPARPRNWPAGSAKSIPRNTGADAKLLLTLEKRTTGSAIGDGVDSMLSADDIRNHGCRSPRRGFMLRIRIARAALNGRERPQDDRKTPPKRPPNDPPNNPIARLRRQ